MGTHNVKKEQMNKQKHNFMGTYNVTKQTNKQTKTHFLDPSFHYYIDRLLTDSPLHKVKVIDIYCQSPTLSST